MYTWTVMAMPTGAATPILSVNGINAAKSSVATFAMAGSYVFQATITDDGGLSAVSSVSVVVCQTGTSVNVTPASVALMVGNKQQSPPWCWTSSVSRWPTSRR